MLPWPGRRPLRSASWPATDGACAADGRERPPVADLARVSRVIGGLRAPLVALQEVSYAGPGGACDVASLGQANGLTWSSVTTRTGGEWQHGNALLSGFPITGVRTTTSLCPTASRCDPSRGLRRSHPGRRTGGRASRVQTTGGRRNDSIQFPCRLVSCVVRGASSAAVTSRKRCARLVVLRVSKTNARPGGSPSLRRPTLGTVVAGSDPPGEPRERRGSFSSGVLFQSSHITERETQS
jgi:hypothetical protein